MKTIGEEVLKYDCHFLSPVLPEIDLLLSIHSARRLCCVLLCNNVTSKMCRLHGSHC